MSGVRWQAFTKHGHTNPYDNVRNTSLKTNPGSGVKKLEEDRSPQFLDTAEVQALLAHCSQSIYASVATAVYAGLRKSELFHLEWTDLDFKNRTITVQSKNGWHPKNYRYRVIPLYERLAQILHQQPRHLISP